MPEPTKLNCPQCGRFLVEATEFAKLPCPRCGAQVTWESKLARVRSIAFDPRRELRSVASG